MAFKSLLCVCFLNEKVGLHKKSSQQKFDLYITSVFFEEK